MRFADMFRVLHLATLCIILSIHYIAPTNILADSDVQGKKVLWVDSYHKGYQWSDGIEFGIRKILKDTGVQLSFHRMDTKINNSLDFCKDAGAKAKRELDRFKPDIVIATDDNAQRCFVVPYLKDTELPVVFSGVNWDALEYGYPTDTITGMVEIDHVDGLLALMRQNASGSQVGFISTDVATSRKSAEEINRRFFNGQMKSYMVKTFQDFTQQFLKAQEEVDMLIFYNFMGIENWDPVTAENFLAQHTRIPTGALLDFLKRYVTYTNSISPEEQGEYAAQTALRVLSGTDPADIPVVHNRNSQLSVNLKMAKSADIILPLSVLKIAEVIGRDAYTDKHLHYADRPDAFQGKKVVWVDSYHQGYEWSDGIGRGIREVFVDKGIQIKIIRMNTKKNKSDEFAEQAAREALKEIEAFSPDAIIASDDNAQKYLIVPHFSGSDIPVIFCGVNRDATMYGYPLPNVTGMLEVEPLDALLELLRQYAKGEKVGYLYSNTATERKMVASYQKNVFSGQLKTYPAETFYDFQQGFLKAQQEVDMLIIPNSSGIADWQADTAEAFILDNVRIPSGTFISFMQKLVLFTMANSPEEQGRYAASTVLRVFNGERIPDIPIARNRSGETTVNVKMANAAGIILPISTLKDAKSVIGQDVFWKD